MSTTHGFDDRRISDSGPAREEILEHLEAVLADRRFAAAERNAGFLRYVVERTLEGKASEIKETVIAVDVYGRAGDYDPKADSIVRVEASRLRQKLKAYYENEGREARVRISLPSGSYVPQFEAIALPVAEEIAPVSEAVSGKSSPDNGVGSEYPVSPFLARQAIAIAGALGLLIVLMSFGTATGSVRTPAQDADALAALQEGIALIQQDPHMSEAEHGAPQSLVRAVERLEFAVARDPKLAPAWTALAEAYDYVYPYVGRDRAEDARRAEAAARTAVSLAPESAAAHHMLGLVLGFIQWNLPQAEKEYRRALALDPRDVFANVEFADLLRETGRVHEAAEQIRKARALLPALPQLATKEAEIQLDLGHADAAIAAANSALKTTRGFLRAHIALGMAYEMKGDSQTALDHYRHVLSVDPTDRRALPAYGYLLARTGDTAGAREIVKRLESMNINVRNCAFQIAMVYQGLGEQETALRWLDRARSTHQAHFPFAAVEPRFRDLRQTPRFQQLFSAAGLKVKGFASVT